MKTLNLHKFSNDVRDLYVKTKNSDIEDLFIKVAQTYSQNFLKWLTSKNNADKVKSLLSYPDIYDALLVLKQIRQAHPISVSVPDIVNFFNKSKFSPLFAVIVSFSKIEDEQAEGVLSPFSDIISVCSAFDASTEIPMEAITKDLKAIHESFMGDTSVGEVSGNDEYEKTKKPTKHQQKISMFSGLLRRFSSDIEGAARRAGLDDFANALGSGILASPPSLQQYVPFRDISQYKWNEGARITRGILSRLGDQYIDANYNFVKERSMLFIRKVTAQELLELYDRRRGNTDMSSFMNEDMSIDEHSLEKEIETLSISDANLLNPDYLAMISAFFIVFHSKLK